MTINFCKKKYFCQNCGNAQFYWPTIWYSIKIHFHIMQHDRTELPDKLH